MQSNDTNWQAWPQLDPRTAFGTHLKESTLKLSLETRNRGDVMIVYCQGRIVYRDEAAALSRMVGELLDEGGKVVLDLSGVTSVDSAGIGELVSLYTRAQAQHAELKYASPSPFVRDLLGLTNVDSVLEIHPSIGDALAAFPLREVWADC
jgi:anti-sigma B factor antagonist